MILVVFFVAFCNVMAQSQASTLVLSLDDCVQLASRFHPQIIRANREWDLAKIAYQESHRQWLPQLEAMRVDVPFKKNLGVTGSSGLSWQLPTGTTIRFQPSFSLYGQEEIDGDVYHFSHGDQTPKTFWMAYNSKFYSQLSIDQSLYGQTLARQRIQRSSDEYAYQQAAMRYYDTLRQAIHDTAKSYRELIRSHNQHQQTAHALELAKRLLKRYELELKAGKIAKSVLLEHEAAMLQSELNLLKLNTSIRQQKHQLGKLIGKPSAANFTIHTDVPDITPPTGEFDTILLDALSQNTKLMASYASVKQREGEKLLQQQSLWPSLALRAELTTPYDTTSQSYRTHFSTGVRMEVPIDNQKQRTSVATSTLQYQLAVEQFMQQCQDTIQQISDNYQDLHYQLKALDIMQKRTTLAKRNYDNAQLKHQNGMISTYELIAQQDQYQSSLGQIVAEKINYINLLDNFYLQTYRPASFTMPLQTKLIRYYFSAPEQDLQRDAVALCRHLITADICEYPIDAV